MCRHPKAEWLKYHPQVSFSNWFGFSWKFKCKRWIVSQMIMESKQKWNWQQNWRHHQTKEKAVRLYFIAINMKSWLQYIHETLKEQQANHCSSSIMASGRIASVSHFCLPCLCVCPFWTWWNRNKSSMETVIRISSSFPWFQIFVKQVIYIELYLWMPFLSLQMKRYQTSPFLYSWLSGSWFGSCCYLHQRAEEEKKRKKERVDLVMLFFKEMLSRVVNRQSTRIMFL